MTMSSEEEQVIQNLDPHTAVMNHPRYVCPKTYGELVLEDGSLVCLETGIRYKLIDTAYADFAPGVVFDEWFMQDPALFQQWMETAAPREEAYQVGVARNYVLPLLKKLGYSPGSADVLSAACGLAADVDVLNDAGYDTWGIDCGNRVQRWTMRNNRERLSRADLFALPFPEASFDFVYCLNVIEHIGTVGDTTKVTPDYKQQRIDAVRSLLRVTKPGGYVLLSGVNRLFPLDFFHLQDTPLRFVRLHSPWEGFSLSCGDYARIARETGYADGARPMPLRGFFSWTRLGKHPVLRFALPVANWMLGCMPDGFYGSALSFFAVALIQRRAN
jgi:SAM-dependent methyltransferase